MKIALAVNGRPHESGVTTYINNVSDALRSFNCDVRVVTIFGVSKYRETHKSFKNKTDSILKGHERLTQLAYKTSKLILSLRLLAAYFRYKYDLIFANDISVVNAVYRWTKVLHIPVVLIVHYLINADLVGQGKIRKDGPVYRYILEEEKRGYLRAKNIISPTHYIESQIEILQPNHAPIKIIRYPIHEENFIREGSRDDIRSRLGFEKEDFLVLFCGRLINRKGPEFPIRALHKMEKNDRQGIKVLYVGDGPDRDKLNQLIESSGLGEQVFLQGAVSHNLISDYYHASDVVVVTSVRHEGFEDNSPNVLFEAMAARVPLIVFKSGGIPEFVEHEKTGVVIEEKNVEALATALSEIKASRQLRRIMAEAAFFRLQRNHAPQVIGQEILDYFADLVRSPK
ncbi:glycosyltransferase family 4 protein [Acidobacteriota bacterium]